MLGLEGGTEGLDDIFFENERAVLGVLCKWRVEFFTQTRQYFNYQRKYGRKYFRWCKWFDVDRCSSLESQVSDYIFSEPENFSKESDINDRWLYGEDSEMTKEEKHAYWEHLIGLDRYLLDKKLESEFIITNQEYFLETLKEILAWIGRESRCP